MNTLVIALEALQNILDAKAPDVFRYPDTWHSAYARQLAADTLARIEEVERTFTAISGGQDEQT